MVYFIRHGQDDLFKIGYTDQPNAEDRLKALQTGNPIKLYLHQIIDGEMDLEFEIHKDLKDKNVRGEWFHLTPLEASITASYYSGNRFVAKENYLSDLGKYATESLTEEELDKFSSILGLGNFDFKNLPKALESFLHRELSQIEGKLLEVSLGYPDIEPRVLKQQDLKDRALIQITKDLCNVIDDKDSKFSLQQLMFEALMEKLPRDFDTGKNYPNESGLALYMFMKDFTTLIESYYPEIVERREKYI